MPDTHDHDTDLPTDAGINASMGRIVTAAKAVDLELIDIPRDVVPAIADLANTMYAMAHDRDDIAAIRWFAAACEGVAETLHQLADDRVRAAHEAGQNVTGGR